MFNSTSPWTAVPVYRQVFQTMCSYLAHHLESSVQQFLGSLVINRFWSVVNHGVVAHQFKISLKKQIMTNLALEKYTSGFLFFFTAVVLTLNSVTVLYSLLFILSFMVLKSMGCLMMDE